MKKLPHLIVCLFVMALLVVLSCQKELTCETCSNNKAPVAMAGADQQVLWPADTTWLDASASQDADGTIVSYKWAQIAGPSLSSITHHISSNSSVKSLQLGAYQFELTVTDDGGLSARDTLVVLVVDAGTNLPPMADAGADQTITLPVDSVLLNGSLSADPDGNIAAYTWTKISGTPSSRIINPTAVETKVDQLVQAVYQFELMVTDNGGLSGGDTVTVSVNPAAGNIAPVSRAGNDSSLDFDLRNCSIPASFKLDGRQSTDADGTIVSYRWTEWRPGTVVSPDSAVTAVKNLLLGENRFRLTVTDNRGSTHEDEVVITLVSMMNRPTVRAELVYVGTLSEGRTGIATAAAGNKIVFAGGRPFNARMPASSTVDVFDVVSWQWTTTQLSEGRISPGSAVLGNKIFLAGGGITKPNAAGIYEYSTGNTSTSSKVDIYDVATGAWSTAQLSSRHVPTGAAAGNRVVFAGGDETNPSNVADVYDAASNTWSATTLSASRHIGQAATQNNMIFFGAGSRDFANGNGSIYQNIDVYDAYTNTWSAGMLNTKRGQSAAIAALNMVRWGGGYINDGFFDETHTVETLHIPTNNSSEECFCEAKASLTAVRKNDFIIFFGGNSKNRFDLVDAVYNSWAIGLLPSNVQTRYGSIVAHNDKLYVYNLVINGVLSRDVYRLDF